MYGDTSRQFAVAQILRDRAFSKYVWKDFFISKRSAISSTSLLAFQKSINIQFATKKTDVTFDMFFFILKRGMLNFQFAKAYVCLLAI